MILILKHIDVEGPGTIETYFEKRGYELKVVELSEGDPIPSDLSDIDAVISMGGPMNVYEEDKYSFLKEEDIFLKRIILQEIPFLGICLGSQLLAKACGAKVVQSPVKEVGWYKAKLDPSAKEDSLFKDIDDVFDVYHWHEDMFMIPLTGIRLATGDGCPHQAMKAGKYAYGLQFHVEVTEKIIMDWCQNDLKSGNPELIQKAKNMIVIYRQKKKTFNQQAEKIYQNFEMIMMERNKITREQGISS